MTCDQSASPDWSDCRQVPGAGSPSPHVKPAEQQRGSPDGSDQVQRLRLQTWQLTSISALVVRGLLRVFGKHRLELFDDLVFHLVTELTGIEITTVAVATEFELDFKRVRVNYVVHRNLAARAVHVLLLVELGTQELIADINVLCALEFSKVILLEVIEPQTMA